MGKSSDKEQHRLQRDPADFSHIRTGDRVRVFMGAGWLKGRMIHRVKNRYLSVNLDGQKKSVACWDARNIEKI
jgi:uncharacterized Fe-S cluster-containing radical SAM superfamily enzyme